MQFALQITIWVGAGGMLVMLLSRRRRHRAVR
jgi:hypothetical protein